MQFRRCTNPSCSRPYQLNEFDGKRFALKATQGIVCPHCGHSEPAEDGCVYLVHALSAEEEARFDAQEAMLLTGNRRSNMQESSSRR